jgi:ribosomal RNA-processing protein 8
MNELDEAVSLMDEIDPSPQPTTDVSGFVNVLRRRGFQLMEEPGMGNRMFVRMRFCKALPPLKGKGVLFNSQPTAPAFIEAEDPKKISDEAEAMVLKPCVYKLR